MICTKDYLSRKLEYNLPSGDIFMGEWTILFQFSYHLYIKYCYQSGCFECNSLRDGHIHQGVSVLEIAFMYTGCLELICGNFGSR